VGTLVPPSRPEFASAVDILVVEDNPGDARLVREALKESRIPTELHVVPDGLEALEYLHRRGVHARASRPNLILLDLNMPRLDGREVLRQIKADPELRRIPVVVMSSSGADEDVARSYDQHANSYVRKPIDFTEYRDVVQRIESFWLHAAQLPSE
jgi:two-component system, chemotaxis family, response regulator Rcp1